MRLIALILVVYPISLSAEIEEFNQLEIFTDPPLRGRISLLTVPIIQKRVGDTLNLTCRISQPQFKYNVFWHVPTMSQNREHKVIRTPGPNSLELIVEKLRDTDNGDYFCEATPEHGEDKLSASIKVNIKSIKAPCGSGMFQCPNGQCIGQRYLCDGREDCKSGADESTQNCGEAPCRNRLHCTDGRCIPFSWCCDKFTDANCTVKEKPPCCHNMPSYRDFEDRLIHPSDHRRYHDDGILQTTIYVAVGSAMALLFIVTVLVVAICRIHLKRQTLLNNRCQTNSRSSSSTSRSHHHHHHITPLYEMCRELHRSSPTNNFQAAPGFLVTYNINNGVQFVGRPVSPPPYTEVVTTPPREGPPPAYISLENLARVTQPEESTVAEEADAVDASTPLTTALED